MADVYIAANKDYKCACTVTYGIPHEYAKEYDIMVNDINSALVWCCRRCKNIVSGNLSNFTTQQWPYRTNHTLCRVADYRNQRQFLTANTEYDRICQMCRLQCNIFTDAICCTNCVLDIKDIIRKKKQ